MLFTSPEFVFAFLPLTFLGFWLLSAINQTAAIVWVTAASLYFYAFWEVSYLWLLVPSIGLNYLAGVAIGRLGGRRRWLMAAAAIVGNLGVLAYFKYTAFLMVNASWALGLELDVPSIALPLGVSFITFQKIAYIVDVYQGKVRYQEPLRFALFVSFFPQLIAGPIAHHGEILPQLRERLGVQASNVAAGMSLFAVGLFKKVIVADGVAGIADAGFRATAAGGHLTFEAGWASALAYTCQIYFDFSGYSDMACGLGLMFGIRLPVNFMSPYKAASIIDFWRRWHITLSRFLRDYLYIPLGGNRKGAGRRWLNLWITMTLGGLWHGAGWTFVIWGAYHGTLLMLNHAFRSIVPAPTRPSPVRSAASVLVTFVAVAFGWVMFRAESVSSALLMMKSMLAIGSTTAPATVMLGWTEWVQISVAVAAVWLLPNSMQIFRSVTPALGDIPPLRPAWAGWRPSAAWAVAMACAVAMTMLPNRAPLAFLYFQF
jgi:D-alanyl-lipoteichoic acid acyltransferase DltB (MBOAT superfamily)